MFDAIDRKILDVLQEDAALPIATVAERVGLSAGPCWRRIKRLEDKGVIKRRVAVVDRRKLNLATTVFVAVKAPRHAVEWSDAFRRVIESFPEIVEAWRLTGEIDYLLKIVVPDVEAYDGFYQRLIKRLEFSNISASIAMEEMKFTTAMPSFYLPSARPGALRSRSPGPAAPLSDPGDLVFLVDRGRMEIVIVAVDVDRDGFLGAVIDHLMHVRAGRHHAGDVTRPALRFGGRNSLRVADRPIPDFTNRALDETETARTMMIVDAGLRTRAPDHGPDADLAVTEQEIAGIAAGLALQRNAGEEVRLRDEPLQHLARGGDIGLRRSRRGHAEAGEETFVCGQRG